MLAAPGKNGGRGKNDVALKKHNKDAGTRTPYAQAAAEHIGDTVNVAVAAALEESRGAFESRRHLGSTASKAGMLMEDMGNQPAADMLMKAGEYIRSGGWMPHAGHGETFGGRVNDRMGQGEGFTIDIIESCVAVPTSEARACTLG